MSQLTRREFMGTTAAGLIGAEVVAADEAPGRRPRPPGAMSR